MIDSSAYPHILDGIVDQAGPETLLALRATSQALKQRADAHLARHVVLRDDMLSPFPGSPKPPSWWRRLWWGPSPTSWVLDPDLARTVDITGPPADMRLDNSSHLVPRINIRTLRFVPSSTAEWPDEYAVAVAASLLKPDEAVVFCAPRDPWALHRAFDTTYNLEHCLQHLGGVAGPSLVIMPLPPRLVLNGAVGAGGRFLRLQLLHVLAIDDVVVILHPARGRLDAFAVCAQDRYCTNCHVLGTVSKALREKRGRRVVLVGLESVDDWLWPVWLGPKQSSRLLQEEAPGVDVEEQEAEAKAEPTPTGVQLANRLADLLTYAWEWPDDAIDDVLSRLQFFSMDEYRAMVGEERWRIEAEQ
ncbi:hypothetical protein CcaverHIS002_0601990 [Cutaneotrichosporon cavernicola]|uniref:Uncharacterized protein n=1 Tax=Cutaneotrichosporon cavernicola TaxID=279322 RepID=A0AA48QWV2_9TREE|nr:uncharacterized protein CcaverHIS019_0502100 [Cutaneotrichosporon cavernicola]BEI85912.1 hypothetical protein CcaverHIS002_0601990 [Cutaneotrichosporon cavernicola]BEI92582.1 hypothetical protein CcaverHIS019_0502100 [Cutaneotrichosporon cavernicola]BEJ00356.1 hypothetical protein CcaverHIS631_0502130 [Cutaneotrichosporon cavernicola]BEJ08126.1 hypothetical protein CcaverHIS641_0502110 [Cutaneotrichosporon cavernicola]